MAWTDVFTAGAFPGLGAFINAKGLGYIGCRVRDPSDEEQVTAIQLVTGLFHVSLLEFGWGLGSEILFFLVLLPLRKDIKHVFCDEFRIGSHWPTYIFVAALSSVLFVATVTFVVALCRSARDLSESRRTDVHSRARLISLLEDLTREEPREGGG